MDRIMYKIQAEYYCNFACKTRQKLKYLNNYCLGKKKSRERRSKYMAVYWFCKQ